MRYWKLLLSITFLLSGTPAMAAQGVSYTALQYAMVTYDESGIDDVEPTALVLKHGQFVNDNVAIEGRIGIGLQDDDVDVFGFDVEVEVKNIFGIYAVFHSAASKSNSVYGVLGYTRGKLEASINGFSDSETESDISFGLGAHINQLNIEYMIYLDKSDFEATAISIGYVF